MAEKSEINKADKRDILKDFEQKQLKKRIPSLKTGDTVRVYAKIKEGDKERIQIFEGIITRFTKGYHRAAITVRKISFGVGVERIFPIHSPVVEKIEKISGGRVRRSRLYYLRHRHGKKARVKSEAVAQDSAIVESLGTVATGPAMGTDQTSEKKSSAAVEAANARKKA